ncbi:hypothetical protein MANY_54160 [Mycolicibacterium anyangense]|uniref:Condensation domain-containing protein n=1 Tax=Mycolicibacterium anyangense TaxID=1431246 RepID=A0A6N4WGA3_9MYCO|nr:condensation domain-containing protein [Mycolicibacterium anyangense]BBZ80079.1 hypothetical protein MANY_54160 [Mycolicibacterium anyangense]
MLRRHQGLRASFHELHDGRIAQVVWADVPVPFEAVTAPGDQWESIAAQELSRTFDLAEPPLVRYTLVSQSATEHRLIQTLHHIVADGWSYPLIFGDIVAHYNAATGAGPAPDPTGVTLRDHVEALAAGDPAVARATWAPVLAGSTPTLLFDDVAAVGEHRSVVRRLSAEHTTALADYARTRAVTVSTVLHAAWGVVLGRLTQRTDAVFGSTVSGRGGALADTDSIVGLLINTIPVTMSWDEQTPLGEVIEAVHRQQTEVLDATHIGLPELARMAGARELFDTLVVVENFPPHRNTPPQPQRH